MDKLRKIIEWTKLKVKIETQKSEYVYLRVREREIWWASLGVNMDMRKTENMKDMKDRC